MRRFQDRWFCVFREASGHNSPHGALRVITSADGVKWESSSLIRLTPEDFSGMNVLGLIQGHGGYEIAGAAAYFDDRVQLTVAPCTPCRRSYATGGSPAT